MNVIWIQGNNKLSTEITNWWKGYQTIRF